MYAKMLKVVKILLYNAWPNFGQIFWRPIFGKNAAYIRFSRFLFQRIFGGEYIFGGLGIYNQMPPTLLADKALVAICHRLQWSANIMK